MLIARKSLLERLPTHFGWQTEILVGSTADSLQRVVTAQLLGNALRLLAGNLGLHASNFCLNLGGGRSGIAKDVTPKQCALQRE